jgi:hypothetical protein
MAANGVNVLVQNCASGKQCDFQATADIDQRDIYSMILVNDRKCVAEDKPLNLTTQVPGDFCRFNYNCASGKCTSNRCDAKVALGGQCSGT